MWIVRADYANINLVSHLTMTGAHIPIRLDVEPKPGLCPVCRQSLLWYQTTALHWESFEADAAAVPDFEPYTPREGGAEMRPDIGYIAADRRHGERCVTGTH